MPILLRGVGTKRGDLTRQKVNHAHKTIGAIGTNGEMPIVGREGERMNRLRTDIDLSDWLSVSIPNRDRAALPTSGDAIDGGIARA